MPTLPAPVIMATDFIRLLWGYVFNVSSLSFRLVCLAWTCVNLDKVLRGGGCALLVD